MFIHAVQIERFILCDDKPDWCKSSDVAVMTYLMAIADENGVCAPKEVKIALCTGGGKVVWKATKQAIERLHQYRWITLQRAKSPGERDVYQIHFSHLPPHPQVFKEGHGKQTEG